jgi:23S rRNA (guanosine2251-2'-O)-methyltransferase
MKPPSHRPGNRGPDRPRPPSGPQRPHADRAGGDRANPGRPTGDRPPAGAAPRQEQRGPKPHAGGGKPRFDAKAAPRPENTKRAENSERRSLSLRPSDTPPSTAPHPQRGPAGTVWLYGIHAVAAALANPARLLRRLVLTEEAEPEIVSRLKGSLPIAPERSDRARLDQLLGRGIVHQGVALLTDPLPQMALQAALERPGPVLVLDQVSDPRNVGAIIRSAAAFGVACVIVQDRNAPDETGAMAKSASGAMERLPLIRAVNIARTLIALRAAGLWIVGLDGGGAKLAGGALAQRRVALVLGNEGDGMRRLTRDTCDEIAGIPLPGGTVALDSLNVSAAAAVALYELTRPQ